MKIIELPFVSDAGEDALRVRCPNCDHELLVCRDGWRGFDGCRCTRFLWIGDDIEFYNQERWDFESFNRGYTFTQRVRNGNGCDLDESFLGKPDFGVLRAMESKWIDAVAVVQSHGADDGPFDAPVVWGVGSLESRALSSRPKTRGRRDQQRGSAMQRPKSGGAGERPKEISYGRDIPWLNVIRFHKEVTRRAEEAFFSLPADRNDDERWSSLHGFSPSDAAGPWALSKSEFESHALLRALYSGEIDEAYLGGPCYFQWRRGEGKGQKWFLDWRPVFYRQIRLEEDEDLIRLIPEAANWEVSPPVMSLMERMGAAPQEDWEALAPGLFEKAVAVAERGQVNLTEALLQEVIRALPEAEGDLRKDFPTNWRGSRPTPWIVFRPPTFSSRITYNLMRDFDRLETMLEDDPVTIGGLALLEDAGNGSESAQPVEVLPIVPLNSSQLSAVKAILESRPMTVISGPPGCGKSQVVLSVLLNAWAEGKSVLFASNNNQAVDVVRQRLEERFEQEFPIAIRAGSRTKNNVEETLRRALQFLGRARAAGSEEGDALKKQKDVIARKKELEQALESNIPQRVDQAVRSALKAYATFQESVADLENRRGAMIGELQRFGYDCEPARFQGLVLQPFSEWLQAIDVYRSVITDDRHRHSTLQLEAEKAARERDRALESVGLDPAGLQSHDWLVSGPGPELFEAWLGEVRGLLDEPIEERLAPFAWREEFERWGGSSEAESWRDRASELASEIRRELGVLTPRLVRLRTRQKRLDETESSCAQRHLECPESAQAGVLANYLAAYAGWVTLPRTKLSWVPLSQRARAKREMIRAEKRLRNELPVSLWRSLGAITDEKRAELSRSVELIHKWLVAKAAWHNAQSDRDLVEERFDGLRGTARALKLVAVPEENTESSWEALCSSLDKMAIKAAAAAETWRKREIAEATRQRVRATAARFSALAPGVPIREAWVEGAGRGVAVSVQAAGAEPKPETVSALRRALYEGAISPLIDAWSNARKAHERAKESLAAAAAVPTSEDRAADWYSSRPDVLRAPEFEHNHLPDPDHDIFGMLEKYSAWNRGWIVFDQETRPALEQKIAGESDWARTELQKAIDAVPAGDGRQMFVKAVGGVLSGSEGDWPVEDIQRAVVDFSPERIRSRIEQCDAQLERLAFDLATERRLRRLQADDQIQPALDSLRAHYAQNNGRLGAGGEKLFRRCLPALPIWVTVANSPHWIPLEPEVFDVLVIDEATQCSLTNLLPLIFRAKSLAVIGDSQQLPAIPSIGMEAEKALATKMGVFDWLELLGHAENDVYRTAVRCLPGRYADVVSLTEHYRSHPLIIGFSNQHVYQKQLQLRKEPGETVAVPGGPGVFKVHVSGQCEHGARGRSWENPQEAEAVVQVIRELRSDEKYGGFSIGVVTPFNPQATLIQESLENAGLLRGVTVGTVHKYQGDERDVMIFSAVVARGISPGAARWVESPPNLINVAVTRAREALFVVADFQVCRQQTGILKKLVDYAETVHRLRETSLEELDLFSWMVVQGWNPEVHKLVGDAEVDFVLTHQGLRLAVEVDGPQHELSGQQDKARDAFLRAQGYDVFRVPTRSVRETPADVIHQIAVRLGIGTHAQADED